MKLRYLSNIIPQQEGAAKVCSVACSPSGMKTAVAARDRSIVLLDENGEQRDKFATKPVDSKYGKKSYIVKCVVFCPDSSKIAVGQSDHVVYVYKIGQTWNEKKVIVNKLLQSSAITALDWPFEDKLLIGLMDGKVRVGLMKTNKCTSLYKTEQPVVSMNSNPRKTSFVSGHQDGSIILYTFSSKSQTKICNLPMAPYCLVFTSHGLMIAGSDRRIFSYTENGIVQQQFDYSDQSEKEFSSITTDPTGQNVVVASFDRLRLFTWSSRRGAWDEGVPLEIKNLYVCTALGWKGDGSTIYCGTLCGGVIAVDCCLRRGMLKSRFETTYVTPSHVILRDVATEGKTNILSNKGLAIDELKMMGRDRFIVAYTTSTMIVADTESGLSSEIDWHSGGNEKFYFEFLKVCIIINAGELTVVEYGRDEALGWVRTELTSPHLISIRINEGKRTAAVTKKIAYLIDPTSIAIVNLLNNDQERLINHTTGIDWLELSENASKILFRDKRSRVTLLDINTERRTNLLSFCTYVQWVPLSDVIVAQSGETLHVWYNPELPEQVTTVVVKGEIEGVLRDADRTEVIVQEANLKVAYELDNTQIEFGSALEEGDFERAILFLENNSTISDSYTMWKRVAELALEQQKLLIAQRCYAAINDFARANMLFETIELADKVSHQLGGDGTQSYKVRANLARLGKRFKEAEKIYLEQNAIDEAISMYQTLHKWDEALELAKATNYPGYEQLKSSYYRALFDTGQDSKAAQLKVSEGDLASAVQLFLKANQPIQALTTALNDEKMTRDDQLMETIAISLLKSHIYDKAGELFEKLKDFDRALESYKNGNAFAKAVQLARFAFPERVIDLEENWGDLLVSEGQCDAAINHFLEANKSLKAVEAAMKAKEWSKAVQIVDVIQDDNARKMYYGKIADHYATVGEFDRAERLFIEADLHKQAITMYIKNNKWTDAYRVSEEFLGKEETAMMYERKAEELEEQGRFSEAEQLFISSGLSHRAVQMYRAADRNDDVVRLVAKYHGDRLQDTHKRLAMDMEDRGDLRAAEEEFLKAGDIKAAINMYCEKEMWNDAYRLSKSDGGETTQKQVALLWAKSLGGEAAVKLLNKFGMLSEAIDHSCESGAFDFAFELAKLGAKDRLPGVHIRMAVQMEEEGNLEVAARHFIEGGKAEEAVAMYIHDRDWTTAEKIAKEYVPSLLPDVYSGEARKALEDGDHTRAESFLLRANRPDIILKFYKESDMWPDALRIAKEYLPHQLPQLQEEFDKAELRSGARGVDSFLAQAKQWETQAEWARAVQAYLKISPDVSPDENLIKQSALKAADLAIKFLIGVDQQLIGEVLNRLDEIGCHQKAAEVLLAVGNTRQAILAFCRARQWSKAKQVASEFLPDLIPEIEATYKESLKNEGRLGELIDVDVISAIDLFVERGQWDKALDTAKQEKYSPLLDKYVAQYGAELLSQGNTERLLWVFEKYGTSANPANFNMYKAVLNEVIGQHFSSPVEEFNRLFPVRDLFLSVYEVMTKESSEHIQIFERYVYALHLMTLKCALEVLDSTEVVRLRLRQALSLLRYSDLILPDRIFYQAGIAAKEYGGVYDNVAFLLLNHYLDLVDAIDEGNGDLVDYSAMEGTDIPTEVSLPDRQWLEGSIHEEVKEWVLAISVDDAARKELLVDNRGVFEASLTDAAGEMWPQCIITGYPILSSKIEVGSLCTDREDLNRFLIIIKTNPTDQLINVQEFISRWAHSPLTMAL